MPGRIFFRNECAQVTATELVVGDLTFSLAQIVSARGYRRRHFGLFSRYVLIIKTSTGEQEVLRHPNGYVVFQLAHAVEAARREANREMEEPLSKQPADAGRRSADSLGV